MTRIVEEELPFVNQYAFDFLKKNAGGRNTFSIIVRNDKGNLEFHDRINRPCYGEMRNYKEKSKNRPHDRFPSDLQNNFPDGMPVGVITLARHNRNNIPFNIDFINYSPWLSPFANDVIHVTDETKYLGWILTRGDVPPTNIVATQMTSRGMLDPNVYNHYIKQHNFNKKEAMVLTIAKNGNLLTDGPRSYLSNSAYLSAFANLARMVNSDYNDLDGGLVWSDRCDYNRPYIYHSFTDNFNPEKPEEFKSHEFPQYTLSSVKKILGK